MTSNLNRHSFLKATCFNLRLGGYRSSPRISPIMENRKALVRGDFASRWVFREIDGRKCSNQRHVRVAYFIVARIVSKRSQNALNWICYMQPTLVSTPAFIPELIPTARLAKPGFLEFSSAVSCRHWCVPPPCLLFFVICNKMEKIYR